jgi:hypothetical protein
MTVHEAFVKLSSMSLLPREKGLGGCGIGITPTPGLSPCEGEGSLTPSLVRLAHRHHECDLIGSPQDSTCE